MASTKYYDNLPTTGNEYGRAFRDVELEKELHAEACKLGLGAQFGGKWYALDVRVIRLPRHGASCPGGIGRFLFRGPQCQSQNHAGRHLY